MLELRFTDDCRTAAGDLDGVDAFFPYEPAIFAESSWKRPWSEASLEPAQGLMKGVRPH
jgi:hypothetical protein